MPRPEDADRERVGKDTRRALLDAAAQAFARSGYAGAKVDTISKQAGFAKGTIYNYFDSKRDLMLALIETISADHCEYVATAVRDADHPAARLQRFFEAGFAWVGEHPAQARVLITTLNGPDPGFNEAIFAAHLPMFHLVAEEILAPGVADRSFRPVDPRETSNLIMTMYLGASSQVDEHGKPWIDPVQVADFALHGLRPVETSE
jgi:AcrR family transcriptional regulator